MLDISESGRLIGEKLFALLDNTQRQELIQYILTQRSNYTPNAFPCNIVATVPPISIGSCLTEIQAEGLYFCLENRQVYVHETEIVLTAKEFDIFALLIMNPHRVLTYDMMPAQAASLIAIIQNPPPHGIEIGPAPRRAYRFQ